MNEMQVANSQIVVGDRSKAAPWYSVEAQISPEARKMLEEYAGIPPDEVRDHVVAMVRRPLPLPFASSYPSTTPSRHKTS